MGPAGPMSSVYADRSTWAQAFHLAQPIGQVSRQIVAEQADEALLGLVEDRGIGTDTVAGTDTSVRVDLHLETVTR